MLYYKSRGKVKDLKGQKIRWFILIGAFLIASSPLFVSAASLNELYQKREALSREIQRNKELANQKKKEAEELKKIISQLDRDIANTQAKINNTQSQINQTTSEINSIIAQIVQKEKELKEEQENQDEAIRVMYESANKNIFEVLIGSESISEVVTYTEYLEALEIRIENTIKEIERLKNELEKKRVELENKKRELERLKNQLQEQSRALEQQRQAKNEVLNQTHQAINQYLAAAKSAESEMANIDALIRQSLSASVPMGYLYGKYVEAGTVIGYEGSTGFSTGTHLHLEVRISPNYTGSGSIEDFLNIGYANTSNPSSNCRIGMPIEELRLNYGLLKPILPPAVVTACWGVGGYGSGWGSKFHGGVDMASYKGAPIYASAGGRVVFHGDLGAWGNAVVIYHGNGMWTLYGHML